MLNHFFFLMRLQISKCVLLVHRCWKRHAIYGISWLQWNLPIAKYQSPVCLGIHNQATAAVIETYTMNWTDMTSPHHECPCPSSATEYICSLFLMLASPPPTPKHTRTTLTSWAAVQMWAPCHSLRTHSSTFVFLWVLQAEYGSEGVWCVHPPPILPGFFCDSAS